MADIDNIYFAAKDSDDCARILMDKSNTFYNQLSANQYLDTMYRMWKAYYGCYGGEAHQISFAGDQGELVQLHVNHFRNIAQHIYVMITANRPILEARAINTDYKSLAQTYIANGILDYYMREKHLEDALKKAAEMAIVLGSGFIKMEWNATAGDAYDADPETGEMQYEGEIEFTNLSPFDVVFDGTKETWNQEWVLCRSSQNRYNLASKYPEYSDKILALPTKDVTMKYNTSLFSNDATDDIFVYEFYHKRTEAMPDGRYMLFVDTNITLLDSKLPYRTLPVFRISASDIMGTPYGYSPMNDIYPIQEGMNALYSTIMTNQSANGVQNLWVETGSDINVNTLEGGLNIIESKTKPEALQLTATAKEVFDFLQTLISASETISGVNSVTRGDPAASLKSGNALALVQSMSLQFVSGLQQSYVKLMEDVGTALIAILKDFAMTPKVIAIVGKNNRPYLKEFTGDKISAINRVVVDVGNPLSRSIAGRVQMAEQLLQMGLIKNSNQYFQIMNTGRLDSAYEGEMDELMLIKRENERLMDAEPTQVSPMDQHQQHIMEHRAVLADPDLRTDPTVVANVMDHIQAHIDALRNTDPALLQLLGQQPLPPPGVAPAPQPGQGGMPQQGGPQPPQDPGAGMAPPQQGIQGPGDKQIGPNGEGMSIPAPATPPPPFSDLPTDPRMMPQGNQ